MKSILHYYFCSLILLLIVSAVVNAAAFTTTSAGDSEISSSSVTIQLQRPRQFLMDIYTRPYRQGQVQHVRADGDLSHRPCWNLASKHVGSISVNDRFVKIAFYRSIDCLGSSSATIQGSETIPGRRHSILKARSVSITKMRPVLLLDNQHHAYL